MKIKLAILDSDKSYLSRIVSVFTTKYADKFEVYSFTDPDVALDTLEKAKMDVLIASDLFEINPQTLPRRCGFAYFVESADVASINGQKAICKFQKAELIYKEILGIFSEKAEKISGLRIRDDSTKIILFTSVSGGTGASSMAAACAQYYSNRGKKTLYLDLEKFGTADLFFSGEGNFNFSDIIFFLKSKKSNLPMKLESCVKHDQRGVYFYSCPKVALDMLELGGDEICLLISELKGMGSYDYIILDMDFALDRDSLKVFCQTHTIVWVGDGTEISNRKMSNAFAALSILEENADAPLTNRIQLLYNKFSNKSGKKAVGLRLKEIGGAPRYEHADISQVQERLSRLEFFEKII